VHVVGRVLGRQGLVLVEVPALGQRHVLRADADLGAVVAVADAGWLLVLQRAGVDAFAAAAGGDGHHRGAGWRRDGRGGGGGGGGHVRAAARLDGAGCAGHLVLWGFGRVLGHCVE